METENLYKELFLCAAGKVKGSFLKSMIDAYPNWVPLANAQHAIWGDYPPANPAAVLRTLSWQLRERLAEAGFRIVRRRADFFGSPTTYYRLERCADA